MENFHNVPKWIRIKVKKMLLFSQENRSRSKAKKLYRESPEEVSRGNTYIVYIIFRGGKLYTYISYMYNSLKENFYRDSNLYICINNTKLWLFYFVTYTHFKGFMALKIGGNSTSGINVKNRELFKMSGPEGGGESMAEVRWTNPGDLL